jgi:hypothetical protein
MCYTLCFLSPAQKNLLSQWKIKSFPLFLQFIFFQLQKTRKGIGGIERSNKSDSNKN